VSLQIFKDPEIARQVRDAEEFGYRTGTSTFFVNVVTKKDVPTPKACAHGVAALKCPTPLSSSEFYETFEDMAERLLTLPIAQQNVLHYSLVSLLVAAHADGSSPIS
jgi:hypothetical protein